MDDRIKLVCCLRRPLVSRRSREIVGRQRRGKREIRNEEDAISRNNSRWALLLTGSNSRRGVNCPREKNEARKSWSLTLLADREITMHLSFFFAFLSSPSLSFFFEWSLTLIVLQSHTNFPFRQIVVHFIAFRIFWKLQNIILNTNIYLWNS